MEKILTLREKIKESGLTTHDLKVLKFSELRSKSVKLMAPNFRELRAIKIPYFTLKGRQQKDFYRIRYLEKPKTFGKQVNDFRKYDQPAGTVASFYCPPLIDWEPIAKNIKKPLFITEGEFKSACACKHRFPTIGLGGVYSWKSKKNQLEHLPEFEWFEWENRIVYIVFDSDLQTNAMVQMALYDLCRLLLDFGAFPHIITLPGSDNKVGLDDFLVAKGAESFNTLIENAKPFDFAKELWRMNEEVILIENLSSVLKRSNNIIMRASTFKDVNYAHWQFIDRRGDKEKLVQTAHEWLKWPFRAAVKDIVYEPGIKGLTDKGNWSIWPGWGMMPKKGDIKPWKEMMKYVFDTDKEACDWFHKWLAIQFQHPGAKLHTAVCLWSRAQGTGKGLIAETILRIFGKNAAQVDWFSLQNARNDWAQHKQFVNGDEITGSDKRSVADRIKNIITQEEIIIDEKYVPSYATRNTINYYFTSNHPNAFYIDEQDRRFFIWAIEKDPLPFEFYIKFREWKEGDGPAALFHYLLHYPLDGFDEKTRAMQTRYHVDMVDSSRSDLESWLQELEYSPQTALIGLDGKSQECDLYTASQLKAMYEHVRGYDNRITAQGMGLALKRCGFKKVNSGKLVRTNLGLANLFVVKNQIKWLKAKHADIAAHYNAYFTPPESKKRKY